MQCCGTAPLQQDRPRRQFAETPAQDARNALMVLTIVEHQYPAVWALTPELARGCPRGTAAVALLETPAHFPPVAHAAQHLRGAIEALVAGPG